jgi:hypothetical protein
VLVPTNTPLTPNFYELGWDSLLLLPLLLQIENRMNEDITTLNENALTYLLLYGDRSLTQNLEIQKHVLDFIAETGRFI